MEKKPFVLNAANVNYGRPNYDSGSNPENIFNRLRGLRASFGNYNFDRQHGPKAPVSLQPYFTPTAPAPRTGLMRLFREGKSKVTI